MSERAVDDGTDPARTTAVGLARAIRARHVSSREVLEVLVERIGRLDGELGAVVTLDVERAAERAAAADEATARGGSWGPLHGVPMTIKDVWETEGLRTTSGAPELADHVPRTDAVAVARLRSAGAVIFGKTNVPIYAGDVQTFNDVFGTTSNPWDTARTPGGSSGGAAAALAAGFTPLELGSDIGGSIRQPAHCTGTFGLKPSWGVVPSRGHIPGPPGSLLEADVNAGGPMARSVEDLALALDVIAGPLPEDAVGWRLDLPAGAALDGVAGLRVEVAAPDDRFPVAREVAAVIDALADRLADAGAVVARARLPVTIDEAADTWTRLVLPLLGAELPEEVWQAFAEVAPPALGQAASGPADPVRALVATVRERQAADQRRQEQRRRWAERFGSVDVVLCPSLPVPAFHHDHDGTTALRTVDVDGQAVSHLDLSAWCGAIGAMLLPVVAVPAGRTAGGLPVGVQVIGPYLQDRPTLAAAAAISAVAGGFEPPPGYSDGITAG